jgi:hypothetical protein
LKKLEKEIVAKPKQSSKPKVIEKIISKPKKSEMVK